VLEPEVDVAVLGPVEVRGAARTFRRPASKDLVVYLAFHRQGARPDEWAAALWPTIAPAPPTLHSTVSDARRALDRSASGGEHLTRVGGRYRLGTSVGTDVERFARLTSSTDPADWKAAFSLIRGSLFDGLRFPDWAVFDGTRARVESMVVTSALRRAGDLQGAGLGADAEWLIRQALRISPLDERLYRALLRSTESQGNRAGLRATLQELLILASDCGRSGGESQIHPETLALYRDLAHDRVPVVGGQPVRL
jgi:DNA-binding SARP family transcriptional activator